MSKPVDVGAAVLAENDRLWAEVKRLRKLLELVQWSLQESDDEEQLVEEIRETLRHQP